MKVDDLTGVRLKTFALGERLGSTSHTAVYRAVDSWGGEYAVKVVDAELEPDSALADRLRRETALRALVDHPAVLPLEETGRSSELTYAAAPYLSLRSLRDLMAGGPLDPDQAWNVLTWIADALDSAHARGLVCRGLKPGNVLVDGERGIQLVEFGVASRRVGPVALASARYQVAEPQYLAPEQVEGREPDWRADVYAMGVLVFEMLTGTPFHPPGRAADVFAATLRLPPPSAHARRPDLPRGLDGVLGKALAKDARERWRSARELLDELVNLPEEAAHRPPAPVRRHERPAVESMLPMLQRMGMPKLQPMRPMVLDSFFAELLERGAEVAGERWPELLALAGLSARRPVPAAASEARTVPVEVCGRLADAFEGVYGAEAPAAMRRWGRAVFESWLRKESRPFRIGARPERKVADSLEAVARSMERVSGERLQAWKQVDERQFWLVGYGNLFAVGRRRPAAACHFWTAALEAALRWGGADDRWSVSEVECGCVTGTYNCIFTVERTPA